MKNSLLNKAHSVVRLFRKVTSSFKRIELRLRGVHLKGGALINSSARLEPSGGRISVGLNTFIDCGVLLRALGGSIVVGDNCFINAFSVIYGGGGVVIGDNVLIAAHTVIVPSNHVFRDPTQLINNQGLTLKGIVIEDDVWIGAGARILDGVVIGRGTVVGAGAVVTRSTCPYSVVGGIPARVISFRAK